LDSPPGPLSQDPRLSLIAGILQEKKAEDILVLDLRMVSDAADCFVICSASSDPHVKALVTALVESLRGAGHKPWHVEGMEQRRWVLIDLVDIVVHVFLPQAREYYELERLWGDAEHVALDCDPSEPPRLPAAPGIIETT
jgi:ribosome-associated protein